MVADDVALFEDGDVFRRVPDWDRGPTDWSRGPLRDMMALALPGGLTYALVLCEEVLIVKLLTTSSSAVVYLASYAIYSRLVQLALMPVIATVAPPAKPA